jgi:hypothetical protein
MLFISIVFHNLHYGKFEYIYVQQIYGDLIGF